MQLACVCRPCGGVQLAHVHRVTLWGSSTGWWCRTQVGAACKCCAMLSAPSTANSRMACSRTGSRSVTRRRRGGKLRASASSAAAAAAAAALDATAPPVWRALPRGLPDAGFSAAKDPTTLLPPTSVESMLLPPLPLPLPLLLPTSQSAPGTAAAAAAAAAVAAATASAASAPLLNPRTSGELHSLPVLDMAVVALPSTLLLPPSSCCSAPDVPRSGSWVGSSGCPPPCN